MAQNRERLRVYGCWVAATVGAAAIVCIFQPGYMSADSLHQLRHARAGQYLSYYAPVMGWIWGLLDRVAPGPFGMLVLQNAIFWSGLALIASVAIRSAWAPAAVLAIGFYPSVLAELGTVWKDVHLCAALVLSTGLLLLAVRRRDARVLAMALVALWYANAMRANALPAILPLAILSGLVLVDLIRPGARAWIGIFAGLLLTVAVVLVTWVADNVMLRAIPGPPFQAPLVHDLVAISVATGHNQVPLFMFPPGGPLTPERAAAAYLPETLDPLFFGSNPFRQTSDPAELAALKRRWFEAIRDHPRAYLAHRMRLFGTLLGIGQPGVWYPYHAQIDSNELGITMRRSTLNLRVMELLDSVRNQVFFRAWIHLAICAGLLVGCLAFRRSSFAAALAASAILYALPYSMIAPAPDFRYLWWPVVATLLAAVCAPARIALRSGVERTVDHSPADLRDHPISL